MSSEEEEKAQLECLNCGSVCTVKQKMEDSSQPIFCPFCGDEIINIVDDEDDYILEDENSEDFE